MTDHFALAVASMETAGILRDSLQAAYDSKPTDVREVAKLNSDLRHVLTVAKLHSNLAGVQATYDLRAVVEQLAKDLNAEPEPRHLVLNVTGDPDPARVVDAIRRFEDRGGKS